MPPEYLLYQAAKYMGVSPWDLDEQPIMWRDWALIFMDAEAKHQQRLQEQQERQQRR